MRRPKPHQLVLAIGVLAALGTLASGILPRDHRVGTTTRRSAARSSSTSPTRSTGCSTRRPRRCCCVCAWLVVAAGPQLRARRPRRPAHHQGATSTAASRDFRAGVWMRTLLRDPAAGVMHSLHLLRVPRAVRRHDHPRDRPPAARQPEVPPRRDVPGVRRHRPTSSASCSSSGILWAIARRYVQRPYRIRIKTKPEDAVILGTFLAHRGHRVHHRGRSASRSMRPARVREVVASSATRCRACSTAGPRRRCATCTAGCGSSHVVAFVAFLVHPADHEAAPHDHVADEHVPAATRTGPRAR